MKIKSEDLKRLQLPAEMEKKLYDMDLDKFAQAVDRIIEDPELRIRLEEQPAETITKELGLPLIDADLKRLEGKKLSEIMDEDFPEINRRTVALGPAATAAAAVAIWAGPIVVAGVYIYAHGHVERPTDSGD